MAATASAKVAKFPFGRRKNSRHAVRKDTKNSCVTRLTLLNITVIVNETPDTSDSTIMPNPKGHEDSIKDSRFKAAWQSGPTRTIRVPITLADATLDYARQLDKGIEPRDTAGISTEKLTPDAAMMLSKLRAKRKKSKVEIADIEALLELLNKS
ncbi:hypothetical protein [Microcoleus sp. Pol17_C1]|uniref:hypothetical protein n=1 Tax=unclassified Microcoleus TaxID=2642155 RepID=UPI002FCF7989